MLRFGQSRRSRRPPVTGGYLLRLVLMAMLCAATIVFLRWRQAASSLRVRPAGDNSRVIETDIPPSPFGDPPAGVIVTGSEPPQSEADSSNSSHRPDAARATDDELEPVDRKLLQSVLDNMRRPPMRPFYHLVTLAAQTPPEVLERHARRDVTYAHIRWAAKNEPDKYRGELIYLKGYVRGLRPYDTTDNEFFNPAGVKTLYQGALFTDDSRPYLYTIIVPEVAEGMPTGTDVTENVTFAGYYLQLWVYGSASDRDRSAPLLVGRLLQWTPAPPADRTTALSTYVAVTFVALLLTISGAIWILNRGVRRAAGTTLSAIGARDSAALDGLSQLETKDVSEQLRKLEQEELPPPADGQTASR